MRDVVLFGEDHAHNSFIGALVKRVANECKVGVTLRWLNARNGHGAVVREAKEFVRDIRKGIIEIPDLIVVATDANCKGLNERLRVISEVMENVSVPVVCAIPDPHIERWFLLDSSAFKEVIGVGCSAPDYKCERARYKKLLIEQILASGITPSFGGIEFAEDIVNCMNIERVARADASFAKFVEDLRREFRKMSAS